MTTRRTRFHDGGMLGGTSGPRIARGSEKNIKLWFQLIYIQPQVLFRLLPPPLFLIIYFSSATFTHAMRLKVEPNILYRGYSHRAHTFITGNTRTSRHCLRLETTSSVIGLECVAIYTNHCNLPPNEIHLCI